MKPAIVIPAFKKREALRNLLNSLNRAEYPDSNIQLVLSLEEDANTEVRDLVEGFTFKAGPVSIIYNETHLGLRKHILRCADLTEKYGGIILLEDDLLVSPDFYRYAQAALHFYENEDSVAGISLYAQRFNETAQLPFEPMPTSWPVYFMQLGSSWGQAWTQKQWKNFREWYQTQQHISEENNEDTPPNILKWPETTWEVEYNKYLIRNKKFIVYPYKSYSTICSQYEGEHLKDQYNLFHVPVGMVGSTAYEDHFPAFNEQPVKYDAFMELTGEIVSRLTGESPNDMEIDLYGTKPDSLLRKKKYVVSPKRGGQYVDSYPLIYRPPEMNLLYGLDQKEEDGFFFKYRAEEISDLKSLSIFQFIKMTDYFSYQPLHSKFFIKGYGYIIAQYFKKKVQKLFNVSST